MKTNNRTKTAVYSVLGIMTLGLLMAYLIRREFEAWLLTLIMLLAAAAVIMHIRNALASPSHIAKTLGIAGTGKDRIMAFDHLRLMALCGVIITHAVQIDMEGMSPGFAKAAVMIWVVTMSANAIYVMLSGALLYRWKEEPVPAFFVRRFAEVVIPLIVYYLWYLAVNYHLGRGWDWVSFRSVPEWLLTGRIREAPHLWLVYVILSVYLAVPFMRIALRDLFREDDDRRRRFYHTFTRALLALFIVQAATPFINLGLVYADFALQIPFTGWLLISLYGFWASLPESRRYDMVTIPLGAAALAAICVICAFDPGEEVRAAWCLNDAFLPAMLCTGIFAAVFRAKKLFSGMNPVFRSICRYSYGIMLIHWYTIHFIVIDRFHVHAYMWGGVGILLSLILTLVFSWIICMIIDNLIVLPLKKIWYGIFDILRNCLTRNSA